MEFLFLDTFEFQTKICWMDTCNWALPCCGKLCVSVKHSSDEHGESDVFLSLVPNNTYLEFKMSNVLLLLMAKCACEV